MVNGWARAVRPLRWLLCIFLAVINVFHVDDIVYGDTDNEVNSAAECVRMVAKLFGFKLKEAKSRGPTRELEALGGLFSLPSVASGQILIQLKPAKQDKYCNRIAKVLSKERLGSAEACKIAGVMQWAQSLMFGRVGRAFLWPIYQRANYEHDMFLLGSSLRTALMGSLLLLRNARPRVMQAEREQVCQGR